MNPFLSPLTSYERLYPAVVMYLKSQRLATFIELRRTEVKAMHLLMRQRRLAAQRER